MVRKFRWIILIVALFLLIGAGIYTFYVKAPPVQLVSSCVSCHGDKEAMEKAGFPEFYITNEMVVKQSRMPGVKCEDCHLGNPKATDKTEAHEGLLRDMVIGVSKTYKMEPTDDTVVIGVRSDNDVNKLLPSIEGIKVLGLVYGLKEKGLLTYDPELAQRTCGKCHEKEVTEYNATPMASSRFQSLNTDLLTIAPHNCRPWLVYSDAQKRLLKEQLGKGAAEIYVSGHNLDRLNSQMATKLGLKEASAAQRACNRCHAGCNDCHYVPQSGDGSHVFTRTPPSNTCYGGGRGSICHAGPEDRRRGAGYFRGDYAFPAGLPTGAHVQAGVECLNCHETKNHDVARRVDRQKVCGKCHPRQVEDLSASAHRNVACESCHIREVGGYQATVMGFGKTSGLPFPLTKHKQYYGILQRPLLIKNGEGVWIPVKPVPHVVHGVKKQVDPAKQVAFRNIVPYRTDSQDAYYTVGTVDAPDGTRSLLWIQMDKMSHALGPGRECQDCHGTGRQVYEARWTYSGQGVTEKISGSHLVEADEKGLRITQIKVQDPVPVGEGYRLVNFAYWIYGESFRVPGDFSLPQIDTEFYRGDPHKVKAQ
ncbi:hypothetical protein [Calderihabitans maritimus]|uniref:Cytochrome C n=1 Tax=Calderihabitans maritimus TaxID=1246530 RepID=A0A1Z5HNI5_9FIRM|nr:hypothetical protein [Calderihabitans maritimus]GAW91083.1 cytochrome C [Calderihabitans maritimus]